MIFTLGISAYYHDSSVALFKDEHFVDFVKEEWVSRVKGDQSFPHQSIQLLRKRWGLRSTNIKAIVFYEKPLKSWLALFKYCSQRPFHRYKLAMRKLSTFWSGAIFFRAEIETYFPSVKNKIFYAEHHKAHAANALAFCNERSAIQAKVFVLDGYGEGVSGAIYDEKLAEIKRFHYPVSLGLFYSAITDYLGFEVNDGEFKVMGLASFGKPKYLSLLSQMIWYEAGQLKIDESFFDYPSDPTAYFSQKALRSLPKPTNSKRQTDGVHADLAASAQLHLENLVIEIITDHSDPNDQAIFLSGGVAMNVALISKISQKFPTKKVFVPPSPGDSGSAFGAACMSIGLTQMKMDNPYFPGKRSVNFAQPRFCNIIKKAFDDIGQACDLLASGTPIAVLDDRMEFGPRALGATSILFHSTSESCFSEFNNQVKKRETFRPLAPICLPEIAKEFFLLAENDERLARTMSTLVTPTSEMAKKYPGYVHVDNTCRLQILDPGEGLVATILQECLNRDCQILINTSFNIAGDPMVYDEVDALINMRRMGLKYIATNAGVYEVL
jgi:carbamoyltransferase